MKTLKCDMYEVAAEGEKFEEWMKSLRPHHMDAHSDAMKDSGHTKEDMKKWIAENKARFESV